MTDPRVDPVAARFGGVAAEYDHGRPSYLAAVLDRLAAVAALGPGADDPSRSYAISLDPTARERVLDAVAALLADHPDVAGRAELTYERPCSLHLCQRLV